MGTAALADRHDIPDPARPPGRCAPDAAANQTRQARWPATQRRSVINAAQRRQMARFLSGAGARRLLRVAAARRRVIPPGNQHGWPRLVGQLHRGRRLIASLDTGSRSPVWTPAADRQSGHRRPIASLDTGGRSPVWTPAADRQSGHRRPIASLDTGDPSKGRGRDAVQAVLWGGRVRLSSLASHHDAALLTPRVRLGAPCTIQSCPLADVHCAVHTHTSP